MWFEKNKILYKSLTLGKKNKQLISFNKLKYE